MAQVDLRHATVQLRDGYTKAGAVNQSITPPANGDLQITVDGFAAAIPNGVELRIVGSTDLYTVTSTTGGSTPTAIHFTPALRTAAGIPIDNAVVTVGPNVLDIVIGEGNCTYDEKRKMEYVRDRRQIKFVRTGDEEPMDVSFDMIWEYLSSASSEPPTVEEALNKEGAAATWVTSGTDPCEPYTIDVRITYSPPCSGTYAKETIDLKEFRYESGNHDLKAGTAAFKGMCKIPRAVKTRGAL